MTVKIYHNPRCSKSRQALEILGMKNIELDVNTYLEAGLTKDEVLELSKMLGKDVIDFIRVKEDAYKALDVDWSDNDQAAEALSQNPKILERPIVIKGGKAVIARPPEELEKLF